MDVAAATIEERVVLYMQATPGRELTVTLQVFVEG